MSAPETPTRATIEELLEHFDDLAQLAANEGFHRCSQVITAAAGAIQNDRELQLRETDGAPAFAVLRVDVYARP